MGEPVSFGCHGNCERPELVSTSVGHQPAYLEFQRAAFWLVKNARRRGHRENEWGIKQAYWALRDEPREWTEMDGLKKRWKSGSGPSQGEDKRKSGPFWFIKGFLAFFHSSHSLSLLHLHSTKQGFFCKNIDQIFLSKLNRLLSLFPFYRSLSVSHQPLLRFQPNHSTVTLQLCFRTIKELAMGPSSLSLSLSACVKLNEAPGPSAT